MRRARGRVALIHAATSFAGAGSRLDRGDPPAAVDRQHFSSRVRRIERKPGHRIGHLFGGAGPAQRNQLFGPLVGGHVAVAGGRHDAMPGATALTRTSGPSSSASARVSMISPALAEQYAG